MILPFLDADPVIFSGSLVCPVSPALSKVEQSCPFCLFVGKRPTFKLRASTVFINFSFLDIQDLSIALLVE